MLVSSSLLSRRLFLRNLDCHNDDLSRYLGWMRDEKSNPFIQGVDKAITYEDLQRYVDSKNASSDALLLGIFARDINLHFGNIKLEPMSLNSEAYLGILIGDVAYRNQGYGFESIHCLLNYAFHNLSLNQVNLGVNLGNSSAVHLYKKMGFLPNKTISCREGSVVMSITKDSFTGLPVI